MSTNDNIRQLFERARTADLKESAKIQQMIMAESKTLASYEPLLPYLSDEMWKLRMQAAEALENFDDPPVARYLIEQFERESEEQVQAQIVITLRFPKTLLALQALIEYAKDRSLTDWVRGEALRSIAISTSSIVIDSLFELINPDEWKLVDSIFTTFELLEESEYGIAEKLTNLLASGKLPDSFISSGITWLGARRFKAASDVIIPFLDDKMYREAAAMALGDMGGRRALPKLLSMVNDPEVMVRHHVAKAIEKLQSE